MIEYDYSKQEYNVYATMDRASRGGVFDFTNFTEAKEKFLELLDHTVLINKHYISNGWMPQYSSPLWDK